MGVRQWLKARIGAGDDGDDVPPGSSLMDAVLGRGDETERTRSLGEYSSTSYPADLADLLRRRQEVTNELLQIDVADPDARAASIPHLQHMLRRYPHPLAYEMLVHAYLDAGRPDEAKGVAFAARQRREECTRSPYPEVRAEVDRLHEWTTEEVEELWQSRRRARA